MKADAGSLKVLLGVQELDRRLDRLAHDRAHLPELDEIASVDAAVAALELERAPVAGRRHDLEREQKRYEDEVASIEARSEAENAKLYGGTVTAVKELQALQDEIAGLGHRQRIVEDQVIELMELIEGVDDELGALAARESALLAERERLESVVARRRSEIDEEAASLSDERAAKAADIVADLLAEYERLRAVPGQVAVAQLVGTTCRGCHLDLPAVEADRLRHLPADDLVHCDECGCILVR